VPYVAIVIASNNVYTSGMSLAEIEAAVKELTPEELTKLAAFVARQDKLGWDAQIEEDFSPGGKHVAILEKFDAEMESKQ
jgi:hypothetical protein